MINPSATPDRYPYQNEPIWSKSEKTIARKALDVALRRELHEVVQEAKRRCSQVDAPAELWELARYLTQHRKEIDAKYDYRASRLTHLFGKRLQENQLSEERYRRNDTLATIRRKMVAAALAIAPQRFKVIRPKKAICIPIALLAFLSQAGFAQCHRSTPLTEEQRELENRTVLVTLKLTKTGVVRDANVIQGLEALREPAVRAAKARRYRDRIVYSFPDPHEITVEVKFPQDGKGMPEVRQALPAGVSSCIPFPTVVRISPQGMQSRLLNYVEPAFPLETEPVEGTLVLRLRIDKDGNVYKAEKVNGPDALVAPVIEAVKAWKYAPYLLNGAPVEVETAVEFKFPN